MHGGRPLFYCSLSIVTGFVLKKDQKKENKEDEISLEDLIEKEVCVVIK